MRKLHLVMWVVVCFVKCKGGGGGGGGGGGARNKKLIHSKQGPLE